MDIFSCFQCVEIMYKTYQKFKYTHRKGNPQASESRTRPLTDTLYPESRHWYNPSQFEADI